nr:MAG TPA: hypothetical protein [Caudoviricetes sp.]
MAWAQLQIYEDHTSPEAYFESLLNADARQRMARLHDLLETDKPTIQQVREIVQGSLDD